MDRRIQAELLGFAVICLMAGATAIAAQDDAQRMTVLAAKPTLTKPEQQELAVALFRLMASAETEAPAFFEEKYQVVMEKCPETNQAHESYWRLTNLYLRAYDPPKHKEVVRILEQFLARYTQSTVLSMKKYPDQMLVFSPVKYLHRSYEELGQYAKIAAYYAKIAGREATFSVYDYFDYASALDKSSRGKDAIGWYQKFLSKTKGNDSVDFMREIAADRIKTLKAAKSG